MMAITLIQKKKDIKIDIQMDSRQRIADTLSILQDSNRLSIEESNYSVFSQRSKTYINPLLTFEQANIFNGDVLYI